jgi:hypothetical protein
MERRIERDQRAALEQRAPRLEVRHGAAAERDDAAGLTQQLGKRAALERAKRRLAALLEDARDAGPGASLDLAIEVEGGRAGLRGERVRDGRLPAAHRPRQKQTHG